MSYVLFFECLQVREEITLNHLSTINLYDDGGDNKFSPSEIMDSFDLQDALTNGTLITTNENGDPITQINPDIFIANMPDLTQGYYEDRFTMEENGNLSNNNRQWSVGNVTCKELFNDTLILNNSENIFGDPDETISSVLGKNKRDGTLTKTGKILAAILDKLDKNHTIKSIDQ